MDIRIRYRVCFASSSSSSIQSSYDKPANFASVMSDSKTLRVGWHREHFLSPLLQLAAQDEGKTFELVECPGGTGEMQVKMREGEIDVCIGTCWIVALPYHRYLSPACDCIATILRPRSRVSTWCQRGGRWQGADS